MPLGISAEGLRAKTAAAAVDLSFGGECTTNGEQNGFFRGHQASFRTNTDSMLKLLYCKT